MKLLCFVAFFLCTQLVQAQKYWDGGGDNLTWNDANNWSDNILPVATDNVVLDNLHGMSASYIVNLGNSAISINSVRISPNISLNNTIRLLLPGTNTIQTDAFKTNGTGYTIVLDSNALFENRGREFQPTLSGTNLTITDSFRINNGGHYLHRAKSGAAGWVARLSKISGTERGVYEYDMPVSSSTISLAPAAGRTYGKLILSSTLLPAVAYIASGTGILNIQSDFQINDNAKLSVSISGTIYVQEDLILQSLATFDFSSNNATIFLKGDFNNRGTLIESGSGLPKVQFNGTSNQNMTSTGSILNSISFEINNAAGVTLGSPINFPNQLIFTIGNFFATNVNLLTITNGATISGASSASFVHGPVKKIGAIDFDFPVGKFGVYAPLRVFGGAGSAATDEFTAEYMMQNPQYDISTVVDQVDIDHISYEEYWKLSRNVGTATKQVQLTVHEQSFCYRIAETFISIWDGSQWIKIPSTSTQTFTPPPPFPLQTGTIVSNNALSSEFGSTADILKLTLATNLSEAENPLPLRLVKFTAQKLNSSTALLEWKMLNQSGDALKYELQRSVNKGNFEIIATSYGQPHITNYTALDNYLSTGTIYYRLKITDPNGKISYSNIASVLNGQEQMLITYLAPNPVSSTVTIAINTQRKTIIHYFVYDMRGRVLLRWSSPANEGASTMVKDFSQLPAGIYQLRISDGENATTKSFVKQ